MEVKCRAISTHLFVRLAAISFLAERRLGAGRGWAHAGQVIRPTNNTHLADGDVENAGIDDAVGIGGCLDAKLERRVPFDSVVDDRPPGERGWGLGDDRHVSSPASDTEGAPAVCGEQLAAGAARLHRRHFRPAPITRPASEGRSQGKSGDGRGPSKTAGEPGQVWRQRASSRRCALRPRSPGTHRSVKALNSPPCFSLALA